MTTHGQDELGRLMQVAHAHGYRVLLERLGHSNAICQPEYYGALVLTIRGKQGGTGMLLDARGGLAGAAEFLLEKIESGAMVRRYA
jgi:hypothetical protein